MIRPVSIALLALGTVLLLFALFSGDSASSNISKLFRGTPDDRTIIMMCAGIVFFIIGIAGLLRFDRTDR